MLVRKIIKILIFLLVFNGCWRNLILDNTKDKILCIDGHCNIIGVDAKSGEYKMLIKNRTGGCPVRPTWINDMEFVYYIDPLCGTTNTIHPLILANAKTGKQNIIYKRKISIGHITYFPNKGTIIQDGVGSRRILLFEIKTGEITESFVLYPELKRLSYFTMLREEDSLIIQGLDTVKYKDLPRYPTGYIQKFSDSLDDIYLYDIGEDELVQLTDTRWSDIHPVWSPNGKYISFASNKEGNYDIYVMELESREITQLTSDSSDDQYPEYSPDGSNIAFISDRTGDEQIWMMDSDGSNLKQLTKVEESVGGPLSWNPKK